MVLRVPRHPTDPEWSAEQYERFSSFVDDLLPAVTTAPAKLSVLFDKSVKCIGHASVLDPVAAERTTQQAVVRAMQIGTAIFATAGATEGTVTVRLGDRSVDVPATGPAFYANSARWLRAFWLAVLCDAGDAVRLLAETPLDLLRASGEESDEFVFRWIRALQLFALGESGVAEELTAALAGTDPAALAYTDPEYVLRIDFPPMNAFLNLVRSGHEAEFNAALAQAVELHRDYWTADEDLADNPLGLVALAPLALAFIANKTGTAVEVESEYLPHDLVTGAWG